ncbi:hypothetical protein ABT382_36100, partial [Streptomyces pharetrae]|uniref:hypothetical protein n=1 Tax=Streptomyces pharetrae TaxID=291370 RepID=UPI00334C9CD3
CASSPPALLRKAGDAPSAALPELRDQVPQGVASAALQPPGALRALEAGPAARGGQRACGPSSERKGGWGLWFYSG